MGASCAKDKLPDLSLVTTKLSPDDVAVGFSAGSETKARSMRVWVVQPYFGRSTILLNYGAGFLNEIALASTQGWASAGASDFGWLLRPGFFPSAAPANLRFVDSGNCRLPDSHVFGFVLRSVASAMRV